jgi:hypothetical protein
MQLIEGPGVERLEAKFTDFDPYAAGFRVIGPPCFRRNGTTRFQGNGPTRYSINYRTFDLFGYEITPDRKRSKFHRLGSEPVWMEDQN